MTDDIEAFLRDHLVTEDGVSRAPTDQEYGIIAEALTAYVKRLGIGVGDTEDLTPGSKVRWKSSGVRKTGEVVAVVPKGSTPEKLGLKAGGGGMSRDHVSYVLRGRRTDSKGEPYGPAALYWPQISQIERVAG